MLDSVNKPSFDVWQDYEKIELLVLIITRKN